MLNLHLDMNPWAFVENKSNKAEEQILANLRYKIKQDFITENNHIGVLSDNKVHAQGLINLADNKEEDGGFHIVPGFKHHLEEWARGRWSKALKQSYGESQTFIVLRPNDPLYKQSVRVTCRAGSIVLWDQRTAHGSCPNDSESPRYAQFFKMFPAVPMNLSRERARIKAITKNISTTSFDVAKLSLASQKTLGVAPWNEETNPKELGGIDEDEDND